MIANGKRIEMIILDYLICAILKRTKDGTFQRWLIRVLMKVRNK